MSILKTSSKNVIGSNGLTRVNDKIRLGGIVTGSTQIGLGANNITFTASTGTLRYGSNLSANFVNRSLVDKGYVTGITNTLLPKTTFNTYTGTTAGVSSANNGITKAGTNIHLGGSLTGNTIINQNGHTFKIFATGSTFLLNTNSANMTGVTVNISGGTGGVVIQNNRVDNDNGTGGVILRSLVDNNDTSIGSYIKILTGNTIISSGVNNRSCVIANYYNSFQALSLDNTSSSALTSTMSISTDSDQIFNVNSFYVGAYYMDFTMAGFAGAYNPNIIAHFDCTDPNFQGITYAKNHGSKFVLRSIPDVDYVTGQTNNLKVRSIAANTTVSKYNQLILVDTSSSGLTVTLPSSPLDGKWFVIKDKSGNASVKNITIAGNGHNVDGSSSSTITTNYGKATVTYSQTDTKWYITG